MIPDAMRRKIFGGKLNNTWIETNKDTLTYENENYILTNFSSKVYSIYIFIYDDYYTVTESTANASIWADNLYNIQ